LTVKPARPQRSRLRLLKIVALPLRNAASQNQVGANRQITGSCLWTDASAYGMSYPEDVAPGPGNLMEEAHKLPPELTGRLRALAHDLSNSIETIMQACYLLGQANLQGNGKKWVELIDTAAQDAASINRAIREILRSQS